MHLVCPKCATSYRLDAATVGAAGRSVRCTRCRHVWFAPATNLEPAMADARDEAAFRAELGVGAAAGSPAASLAPGGTGAGSADEELPDLAGSGGEAEAVAPSPSSDIEVPAADAPPLAPSAADAAPEQASATPGEPEDIESVAARRMPATPVIGRRRALSPRPYLALALLTLVAASAAIVGWRKEIVRHAPQMASLYGRIGLPVNVRGLVFTDIKTANEAHDGVPVLTVEGTVASIASYPVEVPRLRFGLRNTAGVEVYSWTAMPTQTVLDPGEALPFRSRLASPPGDVHDVQVRFFNRRDAMTGVR